MANLIGFKATLLLAVEYSGECVYFPKYSAVTRAARDRAINEEFTGANIKELSRKFNLTPRYIRKIVKKAG